MTNDEPKPQNGAAQRSDEEVFAYAVRVIAETLEQRPEAFRELLDLVGRRVADPINERTWARLDISLTDYLGDRDAADVLEWGLTAEVGDTSRIAAFEAAGSPAVADLVRRLVGVYGLELRDAKAMLDFPHNWKTLSHRVYQAVSLGTTFIELTVDKQNGQTFVLDGPADSTLSLIEFVVGSLRVAGRDAFSADLVEEFTADMESLFKEWRELDDPRGPASVEQTPA